MNKILLTAAALVAFPLISVVPAFAVKGIDAARSCEAQSSRCTAIYGEKGGVTLVLDGGTTIIDCPHPQQDCSIVRIRQSSNKPWADQPATSLSTFGGGSDEGNGGGSMGGGFDRGSVHGTAPTSVLGGNSNGGGGIIQ